MTRTDADEHADGSRTHQVQRGAVRRASADDHRDLVLADELLEVERLAGRILRDVLSGDDGPLNDQQVQLRFEHVLREPLDPLRSERRARTHTGVLDLADALADQLVLDRLLVELLHPARGLLRIEFGDLVQHRVGVLVPRPQTLEVQAPQPTEPTDLDRGLRGDHPVHRRRDEWQVELEGVDVPADIDIFRVTRAPARHDRNVVEPVGPSSRLPDADFDFHQVAPVVLSAKTSSLVGDSLAAPGPESAHHASRVAQIPTGAEPGSEPVITTRRRNRIRAVAPHTVSPGSSKNAIDRYAPQRSHSSSR